jgi:hypothetical protein
MKFLIVLSCAVAAAQSFVLPGYAGLGYHGLGYGLVPSVAKSTIKFKTAGFEPVDVATPADTKKIELVETEHEQEILTPTYAHVAAPAYAGLYAGYHGLPAVYAAAPEVEVKEIELPKIELPAITYPGFGYTYAGLGGVLGGFPFTIPVAAPAAAEE